MNDRIRIGGLRVPCRIGVTDAERAETQLLLVDVEISIDLRAPAQTQELRHTIDYVKVASAVQEVATRDWILVEAFATAVAEEVQGMGAAVTRVRVSKPAAALVIGAAEVSVEVAR